MSLTIIPAGSAPNTDPVSLPDMVSFCIKDDGDGGDLLINMQGINDPTVSDAVDLKTFFVTTSHALFQSVVLGRAFRLIYQAASGATLSALVQQQLVKNLDVTILPLGVEDDLPGIGYTGSSVGAPAGTEVPYLQLSTSGSEGGSRFWRVDLRLRHSITN